MKVNLGSSRHISEAGAEENTAVFKGVEGCAIEGETGNSARGSRTQAIRLQVGMQLRIYKQR
jgi:hypothetical protein